jgi:uncharacterized circularly permuted ATP-grasp superfamily protein/uncharacterized alpha-E superfamily protein
VLDPQRYAVGAARYDEAVAPSGELRPSFAVLGRLLADAAPGELADRQRLADRLLDAEGAGHLVHELALDRAMHGAPHAQAGGVRPADSRPWRLDPVPLAIDSEEFTRLSTAVSQRTRVLEAVLVDLYGERRLVTDGVVPPHVVFGLPELRTTATERAPSQWLVHVGIDLIRTVDGRWRVVQDLVDVAPGLGYALLNRSVMARLVPDALRGASVAAIAHHATVLRQALIAQAPSGRRSPRIVVLTGGPGHPTYVEHSYLAVQMGVHLAESSDLVVRKHRVWLRSLDGLEPIDVVYRRLEDAALDPLESHVPGIAGVPAITWSAHHGGVALSNAFGAAVVGARPLQPYLAAAAHHLLGEELLLDHLRHGDTFATAPVYAGGRRDEVVPGHVVLRLQAVVEADGVTVLPGGVGRVLAPGDDPVDPSAQLVKDVWVVGAPQARLPVTVAYRSPPQVDFGASIPRRAADALFWLGRAAERAETAARASRVISEQLGQDPTVTGLAHGGWAAGAIALLRAARGVPLGATDDPSAVLPHAERLHHELLATQQTVVDQIAVLVQEAMSVRSFLSTTTGRVIGRLARVRAELTGRDSTVDDLDVILVDLAALAGLATESTVRGPAWRFLDLGRRLERSLAVLGLLEAGVGFAVEQLAVQPLIETVLSIDESLVAYRRRYRSDVELRAVLDLLVHDDASPRSLAFQLDRLREHLASLAWPEGSDLVQAASLGTLTPPEDSLDAAPVNGRRTGVDALVLAVRGPLLSLGTAIDARWFADPVNPIALGSP